MKTVNLTEVSFLAPDSSISLLKEHGYTMIKSTMPSTFIALVTDEMQFKKLACKICGSKIVLGFHPDGRAKRYE
tara:strand:+ start:731 stop:952 length:222 start_codon:yes stop_codon:yes gene_type:complete